MDSVTLSILLIIFIASAIRSAFGFGESLIAVPLLALFIPINVAVPITVLVSITIAVIVTFTDWSEIHYQSAKRLILSTLFGTPFGLLLLNFENEKITKVILGIIIIFFSIYSILRKNDGRKRIVHTGWSYGAGFIAGLLGGAFGMNGPPLVLYASIKGWSRQRFRATLHAYFLPASLIGMVGYWKIGLWTETVTHYYLLSLIVVIPAIFIGKAINNTLSEKVFKKGIFLSLIAIGTLLIFT